METGSGRRGGARAGDSKAARLMVSVLVALASAGCGILGGPPFSVKEADSVLSYLLVDYSIGGESRAQGPKVLLRVANAGSQYHELEVVDSRGERVGRVPPFPVGMGIKPLYLKLEPGRYTLQCTVENEDGKIHRDLGMTTELVVE